MFNKTKDDIAKYSENPQDKQLLNKINQKKLLAKIFGILLMIIGFCGVIACFILIATLGKSFLENGFTSRTIVPLALIVPSGVMGGVGAMLLTFSSSINANLYAYQKAIASSFGTFCQNCGFITDKDELYCPKCGKPLKKVCPNCGSSCPFNSAYCGKCGSKLS